MAFRDQATFYGTSVTVVSTDGTRILDVRSSGPTGNGNVQATWSDTLSGHATQIDASSAFLTMQAFADAANLGAPAARVTVSYTGTITIIAGNPGAGIFGELDITADLTKITGPVTITGGLLSAKFDASDVGWTSYTPVWTGGTLGNGTLEGRYMILNGALFVRLRLVWGSTTSSASSNWSFSLPAAIEGILTYSGAALGDAIINDTSTGLRYRGIVRGNTATTVGVLYADAVNDLVGSAKPFAWAVGDSLTLDLAGIEVA